MSTQQDYWKECLASSFEEHGISVPPEVLTRIANDVQGAHENYGMAFYSPPPGEHLTREITELKHSLAKEKEKVVCPECAGVGRLRFNMGTFTSDSECHVCHGEGKVTP